MFSSTIASRGFRPNAFRQTSALRDAVELIILDSPGATVAPEIKLTNSFVCQWFLAPWAHERVEHLPRTNALCIRDTDEKRCDATVGCEWMHA